jgi:hypothetical protein
MLKKPVDLHVRADLGSKKRSPQFSGIGWLGKKPFLTASNTEAQLDRGERHANLTKGRAAATVD